MMEKWKIIISQQIISDRLLGVIFYGKKIILIISSN